jgi:Uncharacterized conserved protein
MKVQVKKNGPYVIMTGGKYVLRIEGMKMVEEKQVLALCRCGHSVHKPLCDGTHARKEFEAPEAEIVIE